MMMISFLFILCLAAPAVVSGFSEGRTNVQPRVQWNRSCKCGQKPANRIVNGEESSSGEYPWMVALCFTSSGKLVCDQQICGATLINDRYILTAAHCLKDFRSSELVVVLREHDLSKPSETNELLIGASKLIVHANYDEVTLENDIGLIKLASPVTIGDGILPVCLPPPIPKYNDAVGIITGWGLTTEGGSSSSVLREADVVIYKQEDCVDDSKWTSDDILPSMLCAGTKTAPNVDSCQGDSGGPLIFKDGGGNYDQIGVVSFGVGCANSDYPGVYTRVNSYLAWIKANTEDGVYCIGMKLD